VARVRVVQQLETGAWKRFVEDHTHANVFHTPEMFEVFDRAVGHRPEVWAVTDDDEVLALFTPVQVTLKDGAFRSLTTRSIAYGSVAVTDSERGAMALRALLEEYAGATRRKSLFTELRHLQELNGLKAVLAHCAFTYEDHLDYLVDLDRPVEDVFAGISSSARKKLRRGLRKGDVTIAEVTERSGLAEWYAILRDTYRRARLPDPELSLFEAAYDVLRPRDMVRFFVALVGSRPVACSAELLHKDTMYGWYGGSDRSYSNYIPNDLLTWHVLEWGARNGFRVYDFGGAGKPDEPYGVREFKAKFGGELVNYGRHVLVHSGVRLAVSKVAYRVYQSARPPRRARDSEKV
jgi:CelD/BcsL family acetyltransferase involved in cellulose biosynthesis